MCALIVLSTHSTTQSLQSNAAAHQKQQYYYMSAWSMSRRRWWLMCRSKSGSERVENKWAGVIYVNIKCLTVLLMALVIAMLFRNSQRLACRMNFDYILFIVPLRANPYYFIDPPHLFLSGHHEVHESWVKCLAAGSVAVKCGPTRPWSPRKSC